jgi:outer membrane protein assembly factor BamB
MVMDGNPLGGKPRTRPATALLVAALCLALVSVTAVSSVSAADSTDTCAFLFDFGNGRMEWVDVPVTAGMTGYDVFMNATKTLGLSETHTYQSPYGNTITSIDGYAGTYNFSNPKQPYDFWRLWIWDDSTKEWYFSDYLLDGIDASSTTAIAMIYVRDPYIGPPIATPEYRDPWISGRGDFTNSGSDLSYDPSGVEMKWQEDLGNGAIDASIVSASGNIFALTSGVQDGSAYTTDSKLFCLSASGEVQWSASVGRGHQVASPLLWNDTVLVASADGKLYAFDPSTGDELWNYSVSSSSGISSSPLVYANLVIVVSDDGTVTAVKQSGTKAWSVDLGTSVSSAPALFDGTLYIGTEDGSVRAVAADGSGILWSASIGGTILGSPVALTDRVIVTYSELSGSDPTGGGVAAVSYDGTVLWKTATAFSPGSAAVLSQGVVAISSQGLSLLSLDGALQWTTSYGSDTPGGSPVTVNGLTYLVTNETSSRIIAVNAAGTVEWSETLDGLDVRASPSISDNMLYVASSGGKVIAFLLEGDGWTIPPVGLFTYTVNGNNVHFDAAGSYGGSGALSFSWEFDDGQTASGVKVDHAFSTKGNHTITLTVTDSVGNSRNVTKVVDLDDPGAQVTGNQGSGRALPATVVVGLAAVALIGGATFYIRWKRKKG